MAGSQMSCGFGGSVFPSFVRHLPSIPVPLSLADSSSTTQNYHRLLHDQHLAQRLASKFGHRALQKIRHITRSAHTGHKQSTNPYISSRWSQRGRSTPCIRPLERRAPVLDERRHDRTLRKASRRATQTNLCPGRRGAIPCDHLHRAPTAQMSRTSRNDTPKSLP
jgi:hypothetical protein